MLPKKKKIIILIGVLFIFTLTGCVVNENLPGETDIPVKEPIPVEISGEEEMPIEEVVPDIELIPKEYANCCKPYLEVLTENEQIQFDNLDNGGVRIIDVAVWDVFGDETPELLYIYWYKDYFGAGTERVLVDYPKVGYLALKIFSCSETGAAEPVVDSNVFIAAGAFQNYCVFLTHERELMLYYSDFSSGTNLWGFWHVLPNQDFDVINNYKDRGDLAKLYYESNPEEKTVYKKSGTEISKEEYDKEAKEIMGSIASVLFQGFDDPGYGLYDYENEVLWKDITPFEAECIPYAEAVAWLEAQIV